jgi:hypothetical protein
VGSPSPCRRHRSAWADGALADLARTLSRSRFLRSRGFSTRSSTPISPVVSAAPGRVSRDKGAADAWPARYHQRFDLGPHPEAEQRRLRRRQARPDSLTKGPRSRARRSTSLRAARAGAAATELRAGIVPRRAAGRRLGSCRGDMDAGVVADAIFYPAGLPLEAPSSSSQT